MFSAAELSWLGSLVQKHLLEKSWKTNISKILVEISAREMM